jgi:bifunctional NMN adenylyltransferase/nudix hydrolase
LNKIGVVIGRFQVPHLTEGHQEILNTVLKQCEKLIVLVGVNHAGPTKANPLSYEAREAMLKHWRSYITVLPIMDQKDDREWSRAVDTLLAGYGGSITLYGGRDSFIPHYKGKLPVVEVTTKSSMTGTEARSEWTRRNAYQGTVEHRCGVIWATQNQFDHVYPTVDIAIFDETETLILLAARNGEQGWRFPGGFVDPTDISLEAAARREAMEETNLAITDPIYVCSMKIHDWRYRGEHDGIMTTLFKCQKQFGMAIAKDDVDEVAWLSYDARNLADLMVEEHKELMRQLQRSK